MESRLIGSAVVTGNRDSIIIVKNSPGKIVLDDIETEFVESFRKLSGRNKIKLLAYMLKNEERTVEV